MNTKNIERLHTLICRALFRINSPLDYDRTTDAIIRLCEVIQDTETDETTWWIGEDECSLADLIPAAYWHYTEWHAGQYSKGYRALSALGQIFSPGMTDGPEPETAEHDAYQALEQMAQGEQNAQIQNI